MNIPDVSIKYNPHVYADPLIIKILRKKYSEGKKVCLITKDKELRIRTRQILKDKNIPCVVSGIPKYISEDGIFKKPKINEDTSFEDRPLIILISILGIFSTAIMLEQQRWFLLTALILFASSLGILVIINKLKTEFFLRMFF